MSVDDLRPTAPAGHRGPRLAADSSAIVPVGGPVRQARSGRVARSTLVVVAILVISTLVAPHPVAAATKPIRGEGSTYVGLAMTQWKADAFTQGLQVTYSATGSPAGLTNYGSGLVDFAGTEAEFSALSAAGGEVNRGYQYVPDVAGAVAVMYNLKDQSDRKVDYLNLSRRTVARIFTGDICKWSDPAISADNKGIVFPDEAINVVYRGGQSGTTALFYDFVANVAPDIFGPWASKNQFPTNVRIIQLDSSPGFACKTQAFNGSDQIAQYVASPGGQWSIAYDEFGYAKTYGAESAWIQNESGAYVLPYAPNISAALESAELRPDLSQDLRKVYVSPNPEAYPISAYSYLVTMCAASPQRPTCKGAYPDPDTTETLQKFMRYIACDGQVNMARIGYAPLPTNLSQEMANSIARMDGSAPETLTPDNCANPKFHGVVDPPSPPPPLQDVPEIGGGGGGGGGGTDQQSSGGAVIAGPNPSGGVTATTVAGSTSTETVPGQATGVVGATEASGGGSSRWRKAVPVLYERPAMVSASTLPVLLLLAVLAVPALLLGRRRGRRDE